MTAREPFLEIATGRLAFDQQRLAGLFSEFGGAFELEALLIGEVTVLQSRTHRGGKLLAAGQQIERLAGCECASRVTQRLRRRD